MTNEITKRSITIHLSWGLLLRDYSNYWNKELRPATERSLHKILYWTKLPTQYTTHVPVDCSACSSTLVMIYVIYTCFSTPCTFLRYLILKRHNLENLEIYHEIHSQVLMEVCWFIISLKDFLTEVQWFSKHIETAKYARWLSSLPHIV